VLFFGNGQKSKHHADSDVRSRFIGKLSLQSVKTISVWSPESRAAE